MKIYFIIPSSFIIMKKVLIVEDNKDFLWILKESFNKQPISLVFAEDGEEGLVAAEKEKPDLILTDILMPKLNGIEMAQKLKEKGIMHKMIFLTNLKDEEHISQVIDITSGTDYIVKDDVKIETIISRVKNKLGL